LLEGERPFGRDGTRLEAGFTHPGLRDEAEEICDRRISPASAVRCGRLHYQIGVQQAPQRGRVA
jgi:hypothetical protein